MSKAIYFLYKYSSESPNFLFLADFNNLQSVAFYIGDDNSKDKLRPFIDKSAANGGVFESKNGAKYVIKTSRINFTMQDSAEMTERVKELQASINLN